MTTLLDKKDISPLTFAAVGNVETLNFDFERVLFSAISSKNAFTLNWLPIKGTKKKVKITGDSEQICVYIQDTFENVYSLIASSLNKSAPNAHLSDLQHKAILEFYPTRTYTEFKDFSMSGTPMQVFQTVKGILKDVHFQIEDRRDSIYDDLDTLVHHLVTPF